MTTSLGAMLPGRAWRVTVQAAALAFATLAVLGLLIGWEGASRAYSVGLPTLFRDHLVAVGAMVAIGLVGGLVVGRAVSSPVELGLGIGAVVVTDVIGALIVTLAIDELRRHPDLLRAILTETAGGLQVISIAIGLAVGFVTRPAGSRSRP